MQSIDQSQAIVGGLFCFGAGVVLSGFNPFPLAIATGLAAIVSAISSDIIAKIGKEKALNLRSNFLLIAAAASAIFALAGAVILLPLEGIAGMSLGGIAFSFWLIVRKWSELYPNKLN